MWCRLPLPSSPSVRVSARWAAIAAMCLATVTINGVDLRLDTSAVGEAVALGQTSIAADLTRFHRPYRVDVTRPPVDYLEIVTPFRRLVLAAQARARAGDRRFGQREALQIDAAAAGQIDVYAELTFHPLNTYVLVPVYRIRISPPSGGVLEPRSFSSSPRYGPRVDGGLVPFTPTPLPGGPAPGRAQPMLGATLLASFDGSTLAEQCDRGCDVVIEEEGKNAVWVRVQLRDVR
jgi:hypothetical protein